MKGLPHPADGRRVVLHVSNVDAMAWGSIDNGVPGDSVWLDRSFDGGATWEAAATDALMFSYDPYTAWWPSIWWNSAVAVIDDSAWWARAAIGFAIGGIALLSEPGFAGGAGLLPFLFLPFGVAMCTFGFWFEAPKTKRALHELFDTTT